ncbi:prolipoprotein diacylglyceryl transferase [bacterium]|nr:prolipoprotein diacylglyceryl transferase [bacterium]
MIDAVWDAVRVRSEFVSILVVVAFASLGAWAWSRNDEQRRTGLDSLIVSSALVAVIAGRLAWVLVESPRLIRLPLDLVQIQSGIDMPVAILAFVGMALWRGHRDRDPLTFASVALPAGLAIYAALCLFRGDCYGATGPAPLAVPFPQFHENRLPIALYEAVGLGVLAAVLANNTSLRPRSRLFAALASTALIEYATEWGRVASLSRFTDGWRLGWLVLALVGLALVVVAEYGGRSQKRPGTPARRRKWSF